MLLKPCLPRPSPRLHTRPGPHQARRPELAATACVRPFLQAMREGGIDPGSPFLSPRDRRQDRQLITRMAALAGNEQVRPTGLVPHRQMATGCGGWWARKCFPEPATNEGKA